MKTVLRYAPKAQYLTRSTFRLILAGAAFAVGLEAPGHVLLVLAFMSLLGPIEIAIAKDLSVAMKRRWDRRDARCTCCNGTGQLNLPDECSDDNCCTECFGTGVTVGVHMPSDEVSKPRRKASAAARRDRAEARAQNSIPNRAISA